MGYRPASRNLPETTNLRGTRRNTASAQSRQACWKDIKSERIVNWEHSYECVTVRRTGLNLQPLWIEQSGDFVTSQYLLMSHCPEIYQDVWYHLSHFGSETRSRWSSGDSHRTCTDESVWLYSTVCLYSRFHTCSTESSAPSSVSHRSHPSALTVQWHICTITSHFIRNTCSFLSCAIPSSSFLSCDSGNYSLMWK